MTRPKGKLLALVVLVGAIGVAAATGAFTVVQAERTADVNVAGDASALLAIEEYDSSSPYTSVTNDGAFQINLDGDSATSEGGQGVNVNAATHFGNLTTITNQGSQQVTVWIQVDTNDQSDLSNPEDRILFYTQEYDTLDNNAPQLYELTSASQFDQGAHPMSDAVVINENAGPNDVTYGVVLDPGDSIDVGLHIDLLGSGLGSSDTLVEEINIIAENTPADDTDGRTNAR